jgi:hypothetical protein
MCHLEQGTKENTGLCLVSQCHYQNLVETEGPIHGAELTDGASRPTSGAGRHLCAGRINMSFILHHFQPWSGPGAHSSSSWDPRVFCSCETQVQSNLASALVDKGLSPALIVQYSYFQASAWRWGSRTALVPCNCGLVKCTRVSACTTLSCYVGLDRLLYYAGT